MQVINVLQYAFLIHIHIPILIARTHSLTNILPKSEQMQEYTRELLSFIRLVEPEEEKGEHKQTKPKQKQPETNK